MPEYTQLTLEFLFPFHSTDEVIDTQVLVVFSDNLVLAVIEQHEIFNIIDKSLLFEEAVNKVYDRHTAVTDTGAVGLFFFAVYLQPFKEIIIGGIEGAEPCFKTVGQDTDLVKSK